ncbi:MAG: DUF4221 family protein [Bacteroidota bacterium]
MTATPNIKPVFVIVLLMLFCWGCNNKSINDPSWKNQMPAFPDSITLQKVDTKNFLLDSVTILKLESFQYYPQNNSVITYNSANSELLSYDYTTTKLLWKLDLKKVKIFPHRSGDSKAYSFRYLNSDSIFYYDYKKKMVTLFDTAGKLLREYTVPDAAKNGFRLGRLSGRDPLIVTNDSIYIPSPPGRKTFDITAPLRDNLLLAISIKTGNAEPGIQYPALYRQALWGDNFHDFYPVYNDKLKNIVISFPIMHTVSVYNPGGSVAEYYAGSTRVPQVTPLRFASDKTALVKMEDVTNYMSQRCYTHMIYDPYRDLYYRLVTSSIPAKDFNAARSLAYQREPFPVVILNGAMQKVGELDFDANKYAVTSLFVSPEGLCLPLKKSGDESMIFDVFAPVKK